MDYKEGMTCGECLKYAFCPVANHNIYHKACMKITTKENYTIEQNARENQIEGDRQMKKEKNMNSKIKKCKNCKGMGLIPIGNGVKGLKECPVCKGTGKVETE